MRTISLDGVSLEDWREMRKMGIGGSDASTICGINPWKTPRELYADKMGLIPNEENEAMYWGTVLEPIILAEFQKRNPSITSWKPQEMYFSEENGFMFANLDGWVQMDDKLGILEIKTSSTLWSEVPDYYKLQVMHNMYVTNTDFAFVVVLANGKQYKEFYIERDNEIIQYLITIEGKFWKDLTERIEPELSFKDAGIMDKLYPAETEGKCLDLPGLQYDCAKYLLAKEEIKLLNEQIDYFGSRIKDSLKDAAMAFCGEYEVYWTTVHAKNPYRKLNIKHKGNDYLD